MDRQPVAEEMDSQEGNVAWERSLQIGQPRETIRAVARIKIAGSSSAPNTCQTKAEAYACERELPAHPFYG